MNNKIIQKINLLQKDEKIRSVKLEDLRKEESRNNQKHQDKVLNYVDVFHYELNHMSTVYDGTNLNRNINVFISNQNAETYEQIEADFLEKMSLHLHNLKDIQSQIGENDDESDAATKSYQASIFLKHEAKLLEIEAKSELARLDAEIEYLSLNSTGRVVCGNLSNENVNNIIDEIAQQLKDSFVDQATLGIRGNVSSMVQIEQQSVITINKLVELWQRRSARQKMRLAATNDEMKVHDNVLLVLESVTGLVSSLVAVEEQLLKTESIMSKEDNKCVNADEQLLVRMKCELGETLGPLVTCLETVGTVASEVDKLKRDNRDVFLQMVDIFENTKFCLDNISKDVRRLYDKINGNISLAKSHTGLSIITAENGHRYERINISSSGAKNELKKARTEVEQLKVDVEL